MSSSLPCCFFVALTFNRQEHVIRNETIGHHGHSGHPYLSLVHCAATRVVGLQRIGAGAKDTPFYISPRKSPSSSAMPSSLHPNLAYTTNDVSACSKRASDAIAPYCAPVCGYRERTTASVCWVACVQTRCIASYLHHVHGDAQPVTTTAILLVVQVPGGRMSQQRHKTNPHHFLLISLYCTVVQHCNRNEYRIHVIANE